MDPFQAILIIFIILFFIALIWVCYVEVTARLIFMDNVNKSLKEIADSTTKLAECKVNLV